MENKELIYDLVLGFLRGILLSLIVVSVNAMIRITVRYFTVYLKLDSNTHLNSSYINKYFLLQFLNAAFTPYLIHGEFEPANIRKMTRLIIWDIHFLLLANAITTPLLKVFNIWHIIRLFK
jgi:hypothetical protein